MEIKTLQGEVTIGKFSLKPHQHRECLAKVYLWITIEHNCSVVLCKAVVT